MQTSLILLGNRTVRSGHRRVGAPRTVEVMILLLATGCFMVSPAQAGEQGPVPDKVSWAFRSLPRAHFHFGGAVGRRVEANLNQWLLPAPEANPGMLEMFRQRDRQPPPQLVPWAGEFVGKYLISAIEALRMTDSAALQARVQGVVAELIAAQAEDGYLGPFPKEARLKGHWDLWGHYHCLQALLLWHERTGDPAALEACRRVGDLMCRTFLDQPMRVYDAGSHEMNMAVLHGLGQLYRQTGEPCYWRLMREIEKDWERAGDYLRSGLAGLEFYQTPRPRWESLHDVQGLLELYRLTGEGPYRSAFEHHWRSIARWDRHNTGGFSTHEQAIGNPYAPGAIETCCTVAWMAMTIDMLRLTGDARVADELELSTYNTALGAQHPSGRWWTYDTPMNGVRQASAHSIVFQARAGTPELNCCSVNGPRMLGMLSEWALMAARDGLVLNFYGPARYRVDLGNRQKVELTQESRFPLTNHVVLRLLSVPSTPFTLHLRIPAWSSQTAVRVNGRLFPQFGSGRYLSLHRAWHPGDQIELDFDLAWRVLAGDRQCAGQVSLYRGPLLLAYDAKLNAAWGESVPPLALDKLDAARVHVGSDAPGAGGQGGWPWLLVEVPADSDQAVRLCDFASAGAFGTPYRSWLPALDRPPSPPITRQPLDGAVLPAGSTWFKWTTHTNAHLNEYRLTISDSEDAAPVVTVAGLKSNRVLLKDVLKEKLKPRIFYHWKVTASGPEGETESVGPPARFMVDPSLPVPDIPVGGNPGPDDVLVQDRLAGEARPEWGRLKRALPLQKVAGPDGQPDHAVVLDGRNQMLVYQVDEFPEEDYSVALWVRMARAPDHHLGQVFSAWAAPMDDPLRLVVEGGKLFARLESGKGYSTPGLSLAPGSWTHVAAVKSGSQLTLFVNGKSCGATTVPAYIMTQARSVALGGNPNYSGPEFLPAAFARFRFYGRALSEQEVAQLAKTGS